MKQAITLVLGFLMIAAIACKRNKDCKPVYPANELHYKETSCSNPWTGSNPIDEELAIKVKDWLQKQSITPIKITITNEPLEYNCKACTCPTGRKIQAAFDLQDLDKAKLLGFYKP